MPKSKQKSMGGGNSGSGGSSGGTGQGVGKRIFSKLVRTSGQRCKDCEMVLGMGEVGVISHYRYRHKELGLSNIEVAKLYEYHKEKEVVDREIEKRRVIRERLEKIDRIRREKEKEKEKERV